MPRVRIHDSSGMQTATWQQTITERIRNGKLVPIISNSVSNDLVLGGNNEVVQAYATYSNYQKGPASLAQMAQFKSIVDPSISDLLALKEDYVNFVKNHLFDIAEREKQDRTTLDKVEIQFDQLTFSNFCNELEYPNFTDRRNHPLLNLAAFELPIYVTTSYHDFLEKALREAGKEPRTDICRWHNELEKIPSVFDDKEYVPSREEPLVYHLHGWDEYPDSLVLTEDEYLQFLVATSQNVGRSTDPVHKRVRQAMSDSSLMLLGYGLQNWDFRSLFWGLITQRTRSLTSVVAIQLEPDDVEKEYLDTYLGGYDFMVTWSEVNIYLRELVQVISNG